MDHSQNPSFILNLRCPLYQGSANNISGTKSGQPCIFANKVLLEHSHVHSLPMAAFAFALQQWSWANATEMRWPTKASSLCYLTHYGSLPDALYHLQAHFYFPWTVPQQQIIGDEGEEAKLPIYQPLLLDPVMDIFLVTFHRQILCNRRL